MPSEMSPLRWWYIPAAVVVPPALGASFIVVTRELVPVPDWADWCGWGGAIAVGTFCVWRLPLPRPGRAGLACVSVPVAGFLLPGFWLGFVGSRYGLWL